mgnify:CR=1 FL=1
MTEPALLSYREGEHAFVADARDYPLLVVRWFGESTETSVRRYFQWLDGMYARAKAERTQLVSINDSRLAKRPPPTVRKVTAELIDASSLAADEYALPTLLVLDSALIRGAVTAMRWLSLAKWNVETVANMPDAIARAFELLRSVGVTPPAGVDPQVYRDLQMPTTEGETAVTG